MNLLSTQEYGEHLYYMVRDRNGHVHSLAINDAVQFDKKNYKDYVQYPTDIGGGLLKFPNTAYQITIVVYAMQKNKKGKYEPREGDKIVKIFTSP